MTTKKPALRTTLARLKKLLLSIELESIIQGVELAAAMDDSEVTDALLADVIYVDEDQQPAPRGRQTIWKGRLRPNTIFTGTGPRQPWHDLALTLLVASTTNTVRDQVTRLSVGQVQQSPRNPLKELPLGRLSGFPNLVELVVHPAYAGAVDLRGMEHAPLKRLHVIGTAGTTVQLPSLAAVQKITSPHAEFAAAGEWPDLHEVEITNARSSTDATPLASGAPNLTRIQAHGGIGHIDGMRSLETLDVGGQTDVHNCPNLTRLRIGNAPNVTLSNCPSIESLTLTKCTVHDVDLGPASLPALTAIRIENVQGFSGRIAPFSPTVQVEWSTDATGIDDLNQLADIEVVKQLTLIKRDSPLSLEPLRAASALRALIINGSTGITDLTPLVGLPELRIIAARDSGVVSDPPEIAHLVSRSKRVDVRSAVYSRDAPPAAPNARASGAPRLKKIPVPEEQRSDWERVVHGLAASEHDRNVAAVELACGLDPEGIEFLLSKIGVVAGRLRARAPFKLKQQSGVPDLAARLLTAAPVDSAAAEPLRQLTSLLVTGKNWSTPLPPLDRLEAFCRLETLIVRTGKSVSLRNLAACHTLKTLVISCYQPTLDGLPPDLERLLLNRTSFDFSMLEESKVTELLVLGDTRIGYESLAKSSVRKLTVSGSWRIRNGIGALMSVPIEELRIDSANELHRLAGHPTIERFLVPADFIARAPDNVQTSMLIAADMVDEFVWDQPTPELAPAASAAVEPSSPVEAAEPVNEPSPEPAQADAAPLAEVIAARPSRSLLGRFRNMTRKKS